MDRNEPHYPVQKYIHRYWPGYVTAVNDTETFDSDLVRLLKDFLGSPMETSVQYRQWLSWIDSTVLRNDWEYPLYIDSVCLRPSKIALYAMVAYGFTDILMDWWESAAMDVSVKSAGGMPLLNLTYSLQVTKLLLKRGVDVNKPVELFGSALGQAVESGSLEMVKELVETWKAEVDVDFEDATYCCPLDAATKSSLEILKYLIEQAGADVNKPFKTTRMSGSALAEAAIQGKMDVVEYLANEAKADINLKLQYGHFENALMAAAYAKSFEVIRFFVNEKKIEVNEPVERGEFGNVLAAAARGGDERTVEFLVNKAGADVNLQIQHGDYGSALVAAAEVAARSWNDDCPYFRIIRFLVEQAKADVNMVVEHGDYRTVLQAVKESHRKDVVEYFEGFALKEDSSAALESQPI